MPIEIPGLSTLYGIHRRTIERQNDILAQRKQLATELRDNCRAWSAALLRTFDEAIRRWENEGRNAARAEVEELIHDFMSLDYYSLEETSPILKFLREDDRFNDFTSACAAFYRSALGVKRLVYGDIETSPGRYVSSGDVGVEGMVGIWRQEVERMFETVSREHMKIRIIVPR